MNKLTIDLLTPYLTHELKCEVKGQDGKIYTDCELISIATKSGYEHLDFLDANDDMIAELCMIHVEDVKPLLRPLSDLTKEIEHNGEKFVAGLMLVDPDKKDWGKMVCEYYRPFRGMETEYIRVVHEELGEIIAINPKNAGHLPYNIFKHLLALHFDVFGLIPQGLAIDLNSIKTPQ